MAVRAFSPDGNHGMHAMASASSLAALRFIGGPLFSLASRLAAHSRASRRHGHGFAPTPSITCQPLPPHNAQSSVTGELLDHGEFLLFGQAALAAALHRLPRPLAFQIVLREVNVGRVVVLPALHSITEILNRHRPLLIGQLLPQRETFGLVLIDEGFT